MVWYLWYGYGCMDAVCISSPPLPPPFLTSWRPMTLGSISRVSKECHPSCTRRVLAWDTEMASRYLPTPALQGRLFSAVPSLRFPHPLVAVGAWARHLALSPSSWCILYTWSVLPADRAACLPHSRHVCESVGKYVYVNSALTVVASILLMSFAVL